MDTSVNVEIIDSRDNPAVSFIIVDNCKAKVLKARLNDICYVLTILNNVCYLKLDTEGCKEAR